MVVALEEHHHTADEELLLFVSNGLTYTDGLSGIFPFMKCSPDEVLLIGILIYKNLITI